MRCAQFPAAIAVSILAATLAFSTATAAPVPLAPADKWNVEYADDLCLLSRYYGDKGSPVVLGFKPAPVADAVRLIVLNPSTRARSGVAFGKASIGVGTGIGAPRTIEGDYISGPIDKGKRRITAIDVKRSDLGSPADLRLLTIKAGKVADLALAIDRPAEAFKALDACVSDLLRGWGMDAEAQAAIASYPTAQKPIASYFESDDYPAFAVAAGVQGTSGVRFMVEAGGGAPTQCAIIESSGSPDLDATSCRLLTARARFDPALDKAGKPMRSLSFTRVRWVVPN